MDAPVSDLCERCRVLEFDDSTIGYQGGTESGGYFLQAEDPWVHGNSTYYLDYRLLDSLPHLPALSESCRRGCSFCLILRQALIQECNVSEQDVDIKLHLCFKSVYKSTRIAWGGLRSLVANVLLVDDDRYGG